MPVGAYKSSEPNLSFNITSVKGNLLWGWNVCNFTQISVPMYVYTYCSSKCSFLSYLFYNVDS